VRKIPKRPRVKRTPPPKPGIFKRAAAKVKELAGRAKEAVTHRGFKVDARHNLDADQWADSGRWVLVKSSWLTGVAYAKRAQHLYVEFKDGATIYYPNVKPTEAKGLFRAPSLGKHIWAHFYYRDYVLVREGR